MDVLDTNGRHGIPRGQIALIFQDEMGGPWGRFPLLMVIDAETRLKPGLKHAYDIFNW